MRVHVVLIAARMQRNVHEFEHRHTYTWGALGSALPYLSLALPAVWRMRAQSSSGAEAYLRMLVPGDGLVAAAGWFCMVL